MDLPADFPIKPKSFADENPLKIGHPKIDIKIFKLSDDVITPTYATEFSSGFDLASRTQIIIPPGETALISTGLKFSIPRGYELQVRSKSGLALKHEIIVLNSPGTVDADYRNYVGVILKNTSTTKSFQVTPGMKVAQAVICPVFQASFEIVSDEKDLGMTDRGQGGFGSTGASY